MKRALFLCLGLLAPALPACAQTVVDGSDKAATPFVKTTLKALSHKYAGTSTHFRQIATHKVDDKQSVCGQISLENSKSPDASSYIPFGATEGQDNIIVFEPRTIPAALDFREVNSWINRGADLEDLEEMGCVPEGSYRTYSDTLNKVLQKRKNSS
ncbi:MAG: hypothetical protein ABF839_11100 [Acetobacter orientalis]|uniref:hypothetical protein n=1 Tax=Acetobacter orientalis TaxID=146474 RepID=UPI0039EB15BB